MGIPVFSPSRSIIILALVCFFSPGTGNTQEIEAPPNSKSRYPSDVGVIESPAFIPPDPCRNIPKSISLRTSNLSNATPPETLSKHILQEIEEQLNVWLDCGRTVDPDLVWEVVDIDRIHDYRWEHEREILWAGFALGVDAPGRSQFSAPLAMSWQGSLGWQILTMESDLGASFLPYLDTGNVANIIGSCRPRANCEMTVDKPGIIRIGMPFGVFKTPQGRDVLEGLCGRGLTWACEMDKDLLGGLPAHCGNGLVEGDEKCDDGDRSPCSPACNSDCTGAITSPECGNSAVECHEICDDGNRLNGDGCDERCQSEAPSVCISFPCRDDTPSGNLETAWWKDHFVSGGCPARMTCRFPKGYPSYCEGPAPFQTCQSESDCRNEEACSQFSTGKYCLRKEFNPADLEKPCPLTQSVPPRDRVCLQAIATLLTPLGGASYSSSCPAGDSGYRIGWDEKQERLSERWQEEAVIQPQ